MKKLLILILMTFTPSLIKAIPANELPLGSYMLGDDSDTSIAKLRNELGFNVFQTGLPSNEVLQRFLAHSIQPIVNSISQQDSGSSPERWSYAHYIHMEVGSLNPDKDYKFQSRGSGASIHESEWVSNGTDKLIGFDTQHYPQDLDPSLKACFLIDRNYEGNYIGFNDIAWNLEISLKIDSIATPPDTVVARFEGWFAPCYADQMPDSQNSDWTVLYLGSVRADSLLPAGQFHTRKFSFIIPDTIRFRHRNTATWICLRDSSYHENGGSIGFNLRIYTTGARTVTIDWVKLYETQGLKLANNDTTAINPIKRFLQQHNQTSVENNIFGWYLRDEPVATNSDPFGIIDSLIRHENTNWRHFTMNNFVPMMRSYLQRSHAELIDMDYYPLGPTDLYTGFQPEVPDQEQHSFQNRMNYMNGWMWEYRNRANDMTKQLWMTPQAFWDTSVTPTWRKPTPSELWCMTNIALCYHTEGFVYWKYNPNGNGQYPGFRQLVNGQIVKTNLYEKMKNDINPYIKAIDSIYLKLSWYKAYAYHDPDSIPSGAIIKSINARYQFSCHCVRNGAEYPTDIGWFHVGEFTNYPSEPGVSYFMLVNRSCSLCEWDSTETSPVIATVKLNPSIVGSDYALIINLAKGTSASDWAGYPETTYSAVLDSTIPYTVTLKAGEGRLFKVIPWDEIPLETELAQPGFVYQGGLNAAGAFAVDSGNTFKLRGPAVINASTSEPTSIYIGGGLSALGYETDSIIFKCDSMYGWGGIAFGTSAQGDFEYCAIRNATTGIDMGQSSVVNTKHCFFDYIAYNGIDNFGGRAIVKNCRFRHNSYKGVNSSVGVALIDSSYFENCLRYGVYISSHPSGTYDSSLVTNCKIERTSSPNPDSSQYGIYASSNAKIRLANNLIRYTGQGGIRLSASNAKVYFDTIRYNITGNGILGENSANVSISYCVLDTLGKGVYTTANTACNVRRTKFKNQPYGVYTYGLPNLGTTADPGNNNFEGCSSWYVRRITFIYPPPSLYAQYNYFGPGTPDSTKFSTGVIYNPWLNNPASKIRSDDDCPIAYGLNSNYPNPFNPQTAISFILTKPAQTKVLIYNVLGQRIKTLVNEYLSPGQYSYIWDGRTDLGIEAASGVYLYRIESGSFVQTKKMTLIR